MRILAAIIAAALFSYMGYSKSWALKLRQRLLNGFAKDINCLCEELSTRPRDIQSISQKLYSGERGEFWQLFVGLVSSSQRAEDAWAEAAEGFGLSSVFTADEKELLKQAGVGLGAKGMQMQVKYMEAASKAIGARAEELQKELARKGNMYGKLGLLAGLAVALIII